MSQKPENPEESGEEESEDSPSESPSGNRPPGFSFTKSAIADLPSCAVQSLHIENETPVEVDDEAFVWKDITPSGTKLAGKTKFKKVDWMKNKQNPLAKTPPGKTKAAAGGKVPNKPSTLKSNPKVAKTGAGGTGTHGLVKAASVPKVPSTGSKNRLKERRPSGSSGQGKVAVTAVPRKASSGTKVATQGDGSKVGGGSKTKLVKHRGHADHGKRQQHGRGKQ